MNAPIGVLGLQGAYHKHTEALDALGVPSCIVRQPHELADCAGLIIPGGESTTMSLLMQKDGLFDAVRDFAESRPVMGVCAGMIMMATEVDDERVTPLGLMPFKALRNHYGRQVHSFITDIQLDFDNTGTGFPAQFIRAPGVTAIDPKVEILARYRGEPVLLRHGRHIALAFHPELTRDTRVHAWWLESIESNMNIPETLSAHS